jgi:hypothetical protein
MGEQEESAILLPGFPTEESLDTLSPLNTSRVIQAHQHPAVHGPSQLSLASLSRYGGLLGPSGTTFITQYPSHVDHEFGFEVLKLNKAEALKVAEILESEVTRKAGNRVK